MGEFPWIGCSALELLERLPGIFPNTTHYFFKTYNPEPGVEVRLGKQAQAALGVRELMATDRSGAYVVKRMLKGIEVDESRSGIKVGSAYMCSWLARKQAQCRVGRTALALYSRCRNRDGRELHIPMMDFRIKSGGSLRHLGLLSAALRQLGQRRGVLLNSGNSYHYYGFEQLTPTEWRRFMTASLLLDPLVDVRYISHRLLAGKASLRLNEVSGKKRTPKVIACLHKF